MIVINITLTKITRSFLRSDSFSSMGLFAQAKVTSTDVIEMLDLHGSQKASVRVH